MSIFYINDEKTDKKDFTDKYDFAKFIEGKSDVPEETLDRIRKVVTRKGI